MPDKTYVYKNASGQWVSGFPTRQAAVTAGEASGLTQFETASVSTESPAYFVRFLASTALSKMIDGMESGEGSGHVVDSDAARAALQKIASANPGDSFGEDADKKSDWPLVIDLMNRLQAAAEAWFAENGLTSVQLGYVDYGSTQLHIAGTSLNVPLL